MKSSTLPLVDTSTAYAPGSTAMMSGTWLWAASADFTATRCSLRPGYAVISRVTFGSKRFLYSSAMKRWTVTWNPTYCQKLMVVGALAFTRGALNSAGFLSSPAGAAGAAGWAPPIWAAARLAQGRPADAAATDATPRCSAFRRVSLGRAPSSTSWRALGSLIVALPDRLGNRSRGRTVPRARPNDCEQF